MQAKRTMNARESAIEAVKAAFEPVPILSAKTIRLYKRGYCDEEKSVGFWLEKNPRVEDYDFNCALVVFLTQETALRILPTVLLGALDDPRFPTDHGWLEYKIRLLAFTFKDDAYRDEFLREYATWLNADQLRAFSMALKYLSETEEWPAERDLLAEGARLLELARAEKAES